MVNRPADPFSISEQCRNCKPANGYRRKGRKAAEVLFDSMLHEQIRQEAISRGWSFSRMVRHLCDASIEGIE